MRTRYYKETIKDVSTGRREFYWRLDSNGIHVYIFPESLASFNRSDKKGRMNGSWYNIPANNWFAKYKKTLFRTPRIFIKKYHDRFKEITKEELFVEIL